MFPLTWSFHLCEHTRFPKNDFCRIVWDSGTKLYHTQPCIHWTEMHPQKSMTLAVRTTNPQQWLPTNLNFPMFPSLLPLQSNFMGFLRNPGALTAVFPPAMLMPSHLMQVQSVLAQVVHQQPAPVEESGLSRSQEYSISVKVAFCKWKEGFLCDESRVGSRTTRRKSELPC